ncbi:MAG: hypothetical protein DMG32_19480 [Acidobacteria bacterium]|nr:MAG: hypothetical protein DMG32_19480 [Acidobacteriota bacterium]
MKTETMRHRVRLLAIVTLATCAFTAAANAQSFTGKFTLPYEVHWGAVVLPAGDYSITMESSSVPALVSSANGEIKMFTRLPITANSEKGAAGLLISVRGDERTVRSVNLPQYGASLIYKPFSKAERELLAKGGQLQTVPVFAAKK